MINLELEKALENAKAKMDVREISVNFLSDLIYCALSFDSSDLTQTEVTNVLNGKYMGVSSEKVRKITNQKNAFLKIVEMAKNDEAMTENKLKDIHQILMEGFNIPGGLYRNVDISVKGSNHTPPSHLKVYDRMEKYITFMQEGPKDNILEYISYCHLQLAKIHPFLDGNGRLARLVLNYELIKNGFAPVLITSDKREQYHNALEEFKVKKDILPFINFLVDLEIKALNNL